MHKDITITWKAFAENAKDTLTKVTDVSFSLDIDNAVSNYDICDVLYRETNLYSGPIWNRIEPLLSPDRTHTALSIGDEITINNKTYRCDVIGWTKVD